MPSESNSITTPSTLLEELVERTRLSLFQLIVAVELVLLMLLLLAAYLDGILAKPFSADFWRISLGIPTIIAYILLLQPSLRRSRDGAIRAFRPLVPLKNKKFNQSIHNASLFKRRREWLAVGIGAMWGLLISQPWNYSGSAWTWSPVGQSIWLTIDGLLTNALLYGFIGFFIYSALSSTRLFSEIYSDPLELDVFYQKPLEPIARWSLSIALFFIGGSTITLAFLPWSNLRIESVITFIPATVTPILVFFLNMNSIHKAMVEAKERELAMVHRSLIADSKQLKEQVALKKLEDTTALLARISSWVNHEKYVKSLPEWPFTVEIRRSLILTSLLPWAVGMIKGFLPQLIQQFVPTEMLEQIQRFLPFP